VRSIFAGYGGKPILLALLIGVFFSNRFCQAEEKVNSPVKSTAATQSLKVGNLPSRLKNTVWWKIAKLHELDPYILYAVALIESANNGDSTTVTPWPWALNKSGHSIIPATRQEANVILTKSIADGNRHIDVGLMQINLHWHGHRVDKPEQLLNPETNLKIGAGLLAEAIQSAPNDLELGIGRYHSWQNVQAAVLYGRRVLAPVIQIANQIPPLMQYTVQQQQFPI